MADNAIIVLPAASATQVLPCKVAPPLDEAVAAGEEWTQKNIIWHTHTHAYK